MWHSVLEIPEADVLSPYFGEGVRSILVLVKSNTGWIDLARFYTIDNEPVQIVTNNGFTITDKIVKWAYIPEE